MVRQIRDLKHRLRLCSEGRKRQHYENRILRGILGKWMDQDKIDKAIQDGFNSLAKGWMKSIEGQSEKIRRTGSSKFLSVDRSKK